MLIVMKILKNLLFTLILIVGTSLAVSAQNDNRKIPPKDPPPTVKPGDKPKEKPRDDKDKDKPRKPEYEAYISSGSFKKFLG